MARQELHKCSICGKTYDIQKHEFCPKCGENEKEWKKTHSMLSNLSNNFIDEMESFHGFQEVFD